MEQGHAIPAALEAFLFGRRRDRRFALEAYAALTAGSSRIPARALDLSRGGLLLEIDSDLVPVTDQTFLVEIPEVGLVRTCKTARLVWPSDGPATLLLGCRFEEPLDDLTWTSLDLPPDTATSDPAGRDASSFLPFCKKKGVELMVSVHEAGGDLGVAIAEGRLVGAGEQTIVCLTPKATLDLVVSEMADRDLALVVRLGLEPFWAVKASLLAVRPAPDSGVELVMVADSAPARLLTRQLELRAAS